MASLRHVTPYDVYDIIDDAMIRHASHDDNIIRIFLSLSLLIAAQPLAIFAYFAIDYFRHSAPRQHM